MEASIQTNSGSDDEQLGLVRETCESGDFGPNWQEEVSGPTGGEFSSGPSPEAKEWGSRILACVLGELGTILEKTARNSA